MSASPPGWGPSHRTEWLAGLVAHVVGLVAGALGLGALLWTAGWWLGRPPLWVLAIPAAVLSLIAARLVPVELEGSPWRVPRSWARFGWTGYAGAFGAALGTGIATKLGSPGLYLVLAWGLAAPRWDLAWPVFLVFALGRAVPFLFIALRAYRRGEDADRQVDPLTHAVGRLAPAEAAVLMLAAAALASTAW